MLIYDEGAFIQIIEGSGAVLCPLIETIYKDNRHTDINELNREYIEHCNFADWSMGFRNTKDIKNPNFNDLMKLSGNERLTKLMASFHKACLIDKTLH